MVVDTNFSTLSLAPQELVSYILDFDEKQLYLKQKNSCKYYAIIPNKNDSVDQDSGIETMPNIANLFDLFPYVMYYNRTTPINEKEMLEFKYSYPLGDAPSGSQDSELLAYFHADSMDLDRLIVRANSLNITSPFTLWASQPVTAREFTPEDMQFKGVECNKATVEE